MIQNKPKKCKGINKAASVKGCGEMTLHRTFGLCANCLGEFLFGTDLGKMIFYQRVTPKAKCKLKAEKIKNDNIIREKLLTKSDHEKILQKEINTIIKYIDAGWPCIATNSMEGKRNAGHYFSTGSNPTLRFHLENIWNQSEHSNMWKSGDTLRYQDGIVLLYGSEYLNRLNSLKSILPIKLSIDEIKQKVTISRSIVKWLKLQDREFTHEERLELRVKFNKQIGIY